MTPPAGWDPPSVKDIRKTSVALFMEAHQLFILLMGVWAHLIKELLCSTEDVFELRQLQEVLLQGFLVGVDLFQFVLQLLKGGLTITVSKHSLIYFHLLSQCFGIWLMSNLTAATAFSMFMSTRSNEQ